MINSIKPGRLSNVALGRDKPAHTDSDQVRAIDQLNSNFGKAVYYLFYNPHVLPMSVNYLIRQRIRVDEPEIGCRVVDAEDAHRVLSALDKGESPTFSAITSSAVGGGWPLETWAADLLLTCKVGQAFDDARDLDVRYFLERRSGPVGAALVASITLPED